MTDDRAPTGRDAGVYDASRDDVSLLRRGPPPARARRRSAWSPEPTTEAGRRRRRRARWATAGIVVVGVLASILEMVAQTELRARRDRDAIAAALDDAFVLRVEVSELDAARSLVFTLAAGREAFAFGGRDPVHVVLALPADDAAIERAVDALVAEVVRRGAGPPVAWPFGLERDGDRALANLVVDRVRARVSRSAAR